MSKLLIAGSRTITNYSRVEPLIQQGLKALDLTITNVEVILSGMAPGVDSLAVQFARQYQLPIQEFPAQWNDLTLLPRKLRQNKYGQVYNALAGFNRNEQMAQVATHAIIIMTSYSPGSQHMLGLVRGKIPVQVFDYGKK